MPHYYDDVYEMKEALKAQGVALSKFDGLEEKALLNQYIIKADEDGVAVFENQYHITPEPDDTLELRRQRLLLRVSPPRPITFRFLKQLFTALKIPAEISVAYNERRLKVVSWNGELTRSQQKLITTTLNSYLPANMIYVYQTWYRADYAHAYIGSATQSKARTVAHAEVLTSAQQRDKFYEFGLWQKSTGMAYVGSAVNGKVTTKADAERRNYE